MRLKFLALIVGVALPFISQAGDPGLDIRPINTTCQAFESPVVGTYSVTTERAFPNLEFPKPSFMTQPPSDNSYWYISNRNGLVWRVENSDGTTTRPIALDIKQRIGVAVTETSQQWGITSIVTHPQFPSVPYLYGNTGSYMVHLVLKDKITASLKNIASIYPAFT